MSRYLLTMILMAVVFFITSCDKGIEPADVLGPTGFEGKITFTGKWTTGITRTHLVVFKTEIKTVDDFFLPNLSFVTDSIPYGTKEFSFNSLTSSFSSILKFGAGTYNYIVVAQQKTQYMTFNRADWFVVGVYSKSNNQNTPATMIVNPGQVTPGININVDFDNPPQQPPM